MLSKVEIWMHTLRQKVLDVQGSLSLVELLLKVYFNTEGNGGHKFFSMRLISTLFILLYFPFIHSFNKCILSTLYLQRAITDYTTVNKINSLLLGGYILVGEDFQ